MNKKSFPILLLIFSIFFLLLAFVVDFTMKQNQDEIEIIENVNLKAQNDNVKYKMKNQLEGSNSSVVLENSSEQEQVLGEEAGKLSVNTASEEELDTIPGVGNVTIQKIVDGRPWENIEDVLLLINTRYREEARGRVRL